MKVNHNGKIVEIKTMPNEKGIDVIACELINSNPQCDIDGYPELNDEDFKYWSDQAAMAREKQAAKTIKEIENSYNMKGTKPMEETKKPYNMKEALKLSSETNIDNIILAMQKRKENPQEKNKNKKKNGEGFNEETIKRVDVSGDTPLLERKPITVQVSPLTTKELERLKRQQELPPLDIGIEEIGVTSTIEDIAAKYDYDMERGISVLNITVPLNLTMTEKLKSKAYLMAEKEKVKVSDYFIKLMIKDIMEKEGEKK